MHAYVCKCITCSAVKSGSSLMQETMIECISICSLSSSSSDRSRDWLSNFCPSGKDGKTEIETEREKELRWTNKQVAKQLERRRANCLHFVSQLFFSKNISKTVQIYEEVLCVFEVTILIRSQTVMCVGMGSICTSCSVRLRVGRCRERVCDVFQFTGITLP